MVGGRTYSKLDWLDKEEVTNTNHPPPKASRPARNPTTILDSELALEMYGKKGQMSHPQCKDHRDVM